MEVLSLIFMYQIIQLVKRKVNELIKSYLFLNNLLLIRCMECERMIDKTDFLNKAIS